MITKDKTQTTIQRENRETIKYGYMPAKDYRFCVEEYLIDKLPEYKKTNYL